MTLLAAFQSLMAKYSGQLDIVVGVPIAGRGREELAGVIGLLANELAVRVDLSGDPAFEEIVARVRDVALDAYEHQDMPFDKLVQELNPERSLSQNPLFQVMFSLRNYHREELRLAGLDEAVISVTEAHTAKFDLSMYVTQAAEGLSGWIEYNTDLFDSTTIDRMVGHFEVLLEAAVDNPGLRLSELPLLTAAEKRQVLIEFNDTFAEYPRDRPLHRFIEEQVERTPDAPALIFGSTQLSYRELNARANQLAHYLRSLGVGPEALVAVCAERSLEMVIALVAILKAGGAYVPVDPDYPAERLAVMLEDAEPKAVLTLQRLLPILPHHSAKTFCLDSDWPSLADQPTANPVALTTGENAAYVIYTSGSTGKPKGVVNIHSGIVNRLLWMQAAYGLNGGDTVLQKTPYSFDVSVWEFFWPLMTGACLAIARPEGHKDPSYLVDLIVERQITTLHFVPSMLRIFLETAGVERCTSLRRVICSGEALSLDLEERFFEKLGAQLHNLYGPTEAAVDVTYWQCAPHSGRSVVPIGRPIWNTQIYILDPNLQPAPIGVPGELHIGGAGLARGYLKRPELTAEKFIADPFSRQAGARLYKTGDLARVLSDGTIEYLGRIDFQVKIRGFRIELGEIEAVLSQHPDVKECAVIAREADRGDDKQLVAYLAARDGAELSTAELRKLLLTHVPEYMVPAAFVYLPALPLSSNGKVDRKALPAPDLSSRSAGQVHTAPRTPAEEMLAAIWEDILKLDRVGVEDNFFELGGHSLLATRVVSRIRQAFHTDLPLRDLFEEPTVAGLAKRVEDSIRRNRGLQAPPLKRAGRGRPLPLSFAQQRLWFIDQLEPGNPIYNIAKMARLRGAIQVDALERALNEVVRRHEVLRTSFQTVDGQPVQVIAGELRLSLQVVDLSHLSDSASQTELTRFATEEARRPFDLAKGPLLRAFLLRLAPDSHVFFVNMHHIVTERWSQGLMWSEIGTLYDAFIHGKPSPLPELAIQYADFAAWQREWLQGEPLERQLSYWKTQLAGAPPVLELPTDRHRPAAPRHRGATAVSILSPELVKRLSGLSRSQDVTLFMTLLAAFQTLLSRYSGQKDIVVGSTIAGRNYAEIEPLIGFFVNTIALRTDLSGDPSFRDFLQRVKEVALGAYAHQDIPFEKLVEELSPDRSLSYNPIFQVAFVQDQAIKSLELPGLRLEGLPLHQGTALFDITWYVVETAEGVRLFVEYDTDLFDASTIERMIGHYQVLLEAAVDNPELRLSELPLLTKAEENQILHEWNHTYTEYPRDACAHELFESQAVDSPDALAVVAADRRLTYRELNQRANQLSHYLRKAGVGPDTMVGVCLERSADMLVAMLAILKAGGAYVPLDPAYPKERLAFMLDDTALPVLLTQAKLTANLPSHKARIVCVDSGWPLIEGESSENPDRVALATNLAYVIYTSGSTGKPKGVPIEHRGLVNLIAWHQRVYEVKPSDRATQIAAPSFDASVMEIWPILTAGASLFLPDDETRIAPARLIQWLERERITLSFLPTAMAERVLDTLKTMGGSGLALRALFTGGDKLRKRPDPALRFRVFDHYGPTENAVVTTWSEVAAEGDGQPHIGKPMHNTRILILDENRKLVPVGIPGELYAAGDGLS
jgi:amino acid adenylation domain-containing protein